MRIKNWKRKIAFALFLVMLITLCAVLPKKAIATETVRFTANSSKSELVRGEIVTYTVDMSQNVSGAGLDLEFSYDDSILELQEITRGDIFNDAAVSDLNDTIAGRIHAVIVNNSILANGSVFSVTFKVKDSAKGAVSAKISKVELINDDYEDVDHKIDNNTLSVNVIVLAESISLNKSNLTLEKGKTEKLIATVLPADSNEIVSWSSNNASVVSVDNDGVITAKEVGNAMITAQVGNHKAQCLVTVNTNIGEQEPSIEESNSSTEEQKPSTEESDSSTEEIDPSTEESDPSTEGQKPSTEESKPSTEESKPSKEEQKPSIEKSKSTAEDKKTYVEEKSSSMLKEESTTKEKTTEISSTDMLERAIVFDKTIFEMKVGTSDELKIICDSENILNKKDIVWSSSDSNVISVEDGKLMAKKAGTAIITATVGDESISCSIVVKEEEMMKNTIVSDSKMKKTGNKSKMMLFGGIMIGVIGILYILYFLVRKMNRKKRNER